VVAVSSLPSSLLLLLLVVGFRPPSSLLRLLRLGVVIVRLVSLSRRNVRRRMCPR